MAVGRRARNVTDETPEPAVEQQEQEWNAAWQRSLLVQSLERARREFGEGAFEAFLRMTVDADSNAQAVAEELGMTTNQVYLAKSRIKKRLRQIRAEIEAI